MQISARTNADLLKKGPLSDPLLDLFPRFICARRPRSKALLARDGRGRPIACLVRGKGVGLPGIWSDWIVAHSPEAALALFERWVDGDPEAGALSIIGVAPDLLLEHLPSQWSMSTDRLMTHEDPGAPVTTLPGVTVSRLTPEIFEKSSLPREFEGLVLESDLEEGMFFVAAVEQGQIRALADASVSTAKAATIQQVSTMSAHRKRGLGFAVTAHLRDLLLGRGKGLSWIASDDNAASLALATKLGFRHRCGLAFVETP